MSNENIPMADINDWLTVQITDPQSYRHQLVGKQLKAEFNKLLLQMQAGDQLWEWEWHATVGRRNCYSFGWVVIRDRQEIASHCHSSS